MDWITRGEPSETELRGVIIDSWLEGRGRLGELGERSLAPTRLVVQVAARGNPRDLVIVEATPLLVSDPAHLEDLGENLCHGMPVHAVGWITGRGWLEATRLAFAS